MSACLPSSLETDLETPKLSRRGKSDSLNEESVTGKRKRPKKKFSESSLLSSSSSDGNNEMMDEDPKLSDDSGRRRRDDVHVVVSGEERCVTRRGSTHRRSAATVVVGMRDNAERRAKKQRLEGKRPLHDKNADTDGADGEDDDDDDDEEEDEEADDEENEEEDEGDEHNEDKNGCEPGEDDDDDTRIEKIFACRWRDRSTTHNTDSAAVMTEPEPTLTTVGSDSSLSNNRSTSMTTTNKRRSEMSSKGREMEYLVKFEGESYRRLKWMTKQELAAQTNDQAEQKILHFHRRATPGEFEREVHLTSQDEGNFLLYRKVDRVIGIRLVGGGQNGSSSRRGKAAKSETKLKEYLIKWQLLGYVQSTWEPASELSSEEDQAAIRRFIEINTSFEFPTCEPPPDILMATSLSLESANATPTTAATSASCVSLTSSASSSVFLDQPSSSHASAGLNTDIGNDEKCVSSRPSEQPKERGVIQGETYKTDAVTKHEGTTRLWQMFLKRKLGADGTYVPSVRRTPDGTIASARCLMVHQQEGIKWLFFNTEVNRHGSLLADEMGLGKTCQSIVFLEHLLDVMSAGRSVGCHGLVVVQKSVLENWRREFDVWTPHLNVLPLCGGREDREVAKDYEHKWMCPETGANVSCPPNLSSRKLMKPDVVLVTYEGLRTQEFRDITQNLGVRGFKWTCVIVDECQKVKSGKSSLLLQLLSQVKRELMILLTGTPIQNTTEELFPMFTLLHPSKFYYEEAKDKTKEPRHSLGWSANKFNATFSNIQERDDCMQLTEELHQLMSPYILRREKSHVLKTIPPKTVKLIKIPLTLTQKRVYSALYHKSIRAKGLKFTNIHMQLRKCCIHPFLIDGMEELIFEGKIGATCDLSARKESEKEKQSEQSQEEKTKQLILESSGKFILLKKMLESFWEQKRKVLVFSFFKTALDLVEDFISAYGFPWMIERVDGQTSAEERQLSIDRFNSDPERFLFLCTTRAGGLGINLTAASVVIHLDSDFNPQHDLQAQARCHRIGQDKNVDVFHFIAEHTYEDHMVFTIAGKKLGLEAVLLGRLDTTKGKSRLDKQQEEKVLRKGVFAAIRDDEATSREAAEFAEASIERILSTKSTSIVLDAAKQASEDEETARNAISAEQRHKLFATATFTVNSDGHEATTPSSVKETDGLDEDRPDFWVKVAQRLGPFTFEEEKPQELTRADRRRGKPVNYRTSYYDDDYYDISFRASKLSRQSAGKHGGDDGSRNDDDDDEYEDEDDRFSLNSGSDESSVASDESGIAETPLVKEDLEIGGAAQPSKRGPRSHGRGSHRNQAAASSRGTVSISAAPHASDGSNTSSSSAASPWAELSTTPSAVHVLVSPSSSSNTPATNNYGLPPGPTGVALALELLYRCLRALKRWKTTRVGETGALRTDDIRDADRRSPWSLERATAPTRGTHTTSAADQLLRQSWLETLQEWKAAGVDWEAKKSSIVDHWAKTVLQEKHELLEARWLQSLASMQLPAAGGSQEQLIQQMNVFFVSEARRLAVVGYGDQIASQLQAVCDEAAAGILTGRHFSRQFTIKKQTWIGAEDFCIKLIFIHLMARRYAPNSPPPPKPAVMRWPPPQLEVNWSVITEVIKRLNRYTGGPERRKAAIHERFYNKLDSRWNHDEFSSEEREILAIAVANGMAPHIVAEEMVGRSLERVKKGMRCPGVLRDAQREEYIIQRIGLGAVVDVTAKFRALCREKNPQSALNDQVSMSLTAPSAVQSQSLVPPNSSSAPIAATANNGASSLLQPDRGPFQHHHQLQAPLQSAAPSGTASVEAGGGTGPPLISRSTPAMVGSACQDCEVGSLPVRLVPGSSDPVMTDDAGGTTVSSESTLIECIKVVLTQIGVQPQDFENLRPSLAAQPIASLATLLKQLHLLRQKDVSGSPEQSSTSPPPFVPPSPAVVGPSPSISLSWPSEADAASVPSSSGCQQQQPQLSKVVSSGFLPEVDSTKPHPSRSHDTHHQSPAIQPSAASVTSVPIAPHASGVPIVPRRQSPVLDFLDRDHQNHHQHHQQQQQQHLVSNGVVGGDPPSTAQLHPLRVPPPSSCCSSSSSSSSASSSSNNTSGAALQVVSMAPLSHEEGTAGLLPPSTASAAVDRQSKTPTLDMTNNTPAAALSGNCGSVAATVKSLQQSLETFIQKATPSQVQLKQIQQRMQTDTVFAAQVVEYIAKLQHMGQ